ncbi:MAG: PilZ domain-containing protein [Hyphomicrobiales bacterium]
MHAKIERRNMDRQWCKCEANWSYFNKESSLKGRILNFSPGGSYLETASPVTPGATVLIRVLQCAEFMREHPKDLRSNAIAEVKWCREMKDSEEASYGVGVRYHFPV